MITNVYEIFNMSLRLKTQCFSFTADDLYLL